MRTILLGFVIFLVTAVAAWAAPEVHMKWKVQGKEIIELDVLGYADVFQECLSSGLEVRYRYEVKLCDRRKLWLDNCLDTVSFTQALQYDAISQDYRLSIDRRGDDVTPVLTHLTKESEALQRVSKLADLALESLGLN